MSAHYDRAHDTVALAATIGGAVVAVAGTAGNVLIAWFKRDQNLKLAELLRTRA